MRDQQAGELIDFISNLDPSYYDLCNGIIRRLVSENNNLHNEQSYADNSNLCQVENNFITNNTNNDSLLNSFSSGKLHITNKIIQQENFTTTYNGNSFKKINTNINELNSGKNQIDSILCFTSNFPLVNISKEDEQKLFDININLKFGSSLQISNNLYIIYSTILNDFPIEYLLQNSDLLKTILVMIEKTNFYEYGVHLYKILDKILILIEHKIKFYKESYINSSFSSIKTKNKNMKETYQNTFVYPPLQNDKNSYQKDITSNSISVTDFLVMSMEALFLSMYQLDNFPYCLDLLEKIFSLLKKTIVNNATDQWVALINHLITKCHLLIQHLKNENVEVDALINFFLQILLNFNEDSLVKFLHHNMPDVFIKIKDVIFVYKINDGKPKILINDFFNKLENIVQNNFTNSSAKENSELYKQISNVINDYENAECIKNSIDITKRISCNLDDYNYFFENFDNLLIGLKYILEVSYDDMMDEINVINMFCGAFKNLPNSEIVVNSFVKLLSFSLQLNMNYDHKFKFNLYNSIYSNLNNGIFDIFLTSPEIILIIYDELGDEHITPELETLLLNILYDVFTKILLNNKETEHSLLLMNILSIFPYSKLELRFVSLHQKICIKILENKILKNTKFIYDYIRLLFHKDEKIRLNSVNYLIPLSFEETIKTKKFKVLEIVELKSNYDKLKTKDTLLYIKSAQREFLNLLQHIMQNENNELEFYPLLNIIFSSKLENNLKVSAIEQILLFINKKEYQHIFINEIVDHIFSELRDIFSSENFTQNYSENLKKLNSDSINYLTSLLKLLCSIIYKHIREEKINSLIYNTESENLSFLVHNLLKILFVDMKNKHILCVYSILFLFLISCDSCLNFNNTIQLNEDEKIKTNLKIPKILEKFYFVDLFPNNNFYLLSESKSDPIANLSFNKHVIEYLNSSSKENKSIFSIQSIKNNISKHFNTNSSSSDPNYLEIFYCFTKYFSFVIFNYISPNNDHSIAINLKANENSLISILSFFKKILPLGDEEKNIIVDFLNMFSVFNKLSKFVIYSNKVFVKIINDIILHYISYMTDEKEIIKDLDKPWSENQILIYTCLEFLNENKIFFNDEKISFISQNLDLIKKFITNLSNTLLFDENFYALNLNMLKFKINYFEILFKIENNDEFIFNTINYIDFYLSKFDPSESFNQKYFIQTCLILINKFATLKNENVKLHLIKKSFCLVKYLFTNFSDFNILVIDILIKLLSFDLFKKHPILITNIYEFVLSTDTTYLVKINCINFLNLSLDFLLKNKQIDNEEEEIDFFTETMTLNSKLINDSNLLKNMITNNLDKNSLYCSSLFRLVNNILMVNSALETNSHNDLSKLLQNFVSQTNYFDLVNEILLQESQNLENIKQTNFNNEKSNINVSFIDQKFLTKLNNNNKLESLINVNESITILLKSLPKIELNVDKFKIILNQIFSNLIQFAKHLVDCVSTDYNPRQNLIIEEFSVNYFSFFNLLYNHNSNFINENLKNMSNVDECKVQEYFDINFDLLKLGIESNKKDNLSEVTLIFAKNLPFYLESLNYLHNDKDQPIYSIKNEGEILLELMTTLKFIYNIKLDNYNTKYKCIFSICEENISSKNVIINALSSILLVSTTCKKIFIKSNFINTFIDYIRQLNSLLYECSINKPTQNSKQGKLAQSSNSVSELQKYEKEAKLEYLLNEYKNVLILLQNLMYNFEDCEEKIKLFININKNKSEVEEPKIFLKMLYDIFYETMRHYDLFENYLKLLINTISKSDMIKRSFTLNIREKETFMSLILDYFNKNFSVFLNNSNFELFINLLQCLFQNKHIILNLLKTKYLDNITKALENQIANKNFLKSSSNLKFIELVLNLYISLSFDYEVSKKIATKSFVDCLTNLILKIKNENIIFNIIFIFRNFSFVPNNKLHFMANENLLGTILAVLSRDSTLKIKFIISHLLWILIFNNQSVNNILTLDEIVTKSGGI